MKYRLKNAEIEAVRWDGKPETVKDIQDMLPGYDVKVVDLACDAFLDIRNQNGRGVQASLRVDMWILSNVDVMTGYQFSELYEPVTEPETCVWNMDSWYRPNPFAAEICDITSDCGFQTNIIDDEHDEFNYCPKCGRKIEERA